jgi:hypothetical protein
MATSLHTRLAPEMHLAGEEFLQVSVNREELQKLRERMRIRVIWTRGGQHFKPE